MRIAIDKVSDVPRAICEAYIERAVVRIGGRDRSSQRCGPFIARNQSGAECREIVRPERVRMNARGPSFLSGLMIVSQFKFVR